MASIGAPIHWAITAWGPFVFIFFGLVAVGGTYYVQAGSLETSALLAALPIGCLATAILVVNNLRDRENDKKAGKRTLAVRLGERFTRWEYIYLLGFAYSVPLFIWLTGRASFWILLPLLTLPLVPPHQGYPCRKGRPLNRTLAKTASLELIYGFCYSWATLSIDYLFKDFHKQILFSPSPKKIKKPDPSGLYSNNTSKHILIGHPGQESMMK